MTMYRCTNTRLQSGEERPPCVWWSHARSAGVSTHTHTHRGCSQGVQTFTFITFTTISSPYFKWQKKTMQSSCYFTSSFLLSSCSAHELSTLQTTSLFTCVNFWATPVVRLLRTHFYIILELQEWQDLTEGDTQIFFWKTNFHFFIYND